MRMFYNAFCKPLAGCLAVVLMALSPNALVAWQSDNEDGTFTNPVLYADYPDPDIIRVEDRFYMVSTSFVDSPGINILHSEDLVNWELVAHVADVVDGGSDYDLEGDEAYRGGYWACSIRHYDGTFYVLVNPTFGNARLYYADEIGGAWQYHQLDRTAYDPGLFFDDDGTGYIFSGHSQMTLMELSADYSSVISQTNNVFDAGGEGAHVIKRGDYYYVFNANPSVWPFQLRCSRSLSLTGPWETGRVVLTATTGGHQGSVVQLEDGSWMGFAHQDSGAIGRMPKIGPVFWEDDWPVFGTPENRNQIADTVAKPILGKALKVPATSGGFESAELGMQWQWNHNPDHSRWSLSERSGFLRLRPRLADRFWTAKNTLTQKGQGPQSHGIAKLDLSALERGDVAGLGTLGKGNGNIFVRVDENGERFIGSSFENRGVGRHDGAVPIPFEGDTIYFRVDLDFDEELGVCSFSSDGLSWTRFGGLFTLGFDITHSTFQGQKFALFCYNTESDDSSGYVDVDSFTFGATAEQLAMQRGRPVLNVSGTTFVGDNGQLLRGPFTSTEWGDPPPASAFAAIKEIGLNAVHLYGEVFDPEYPAEGSQAPGYSAARIDEVVEMTRELGLYLVLTIGNGANNGSFNRDFALDFWEFYAPRYKDETHVIYEIHNEPVAWTPPYPQAVLDMELDAYNLIRSHAPDTPVLLFSYAVLNSGNAALSDLAKIGGSIDWSNAGVAFHGYAGHEETPENLQIILDAGYPAFMTEFTVSEWGYSIDHIDLELTASLERMEVSWLNFLHIPPNFINQAVTEPNAFYDIVNKSGLSWLADYSDWPVQRGVYGNDGVPPGTADTWSNDRLIGDLRIEAEDFDEGGQGVAYSDQSLANTGGAYRPEERVDIVSINDAGSGFAIDSTQAGEWLEYTIYVWEPGYYDFSLRYASSAADASVRASFNGVDSTQSVALPSTGGSGVWATVSEAVFLEYGQQKLRLSVESGGFSLNWMELSPAEEGPLADGTYKLVNRNSGLAMGGNASSSEAVQSPYAGVSQEWTIEHLGAGNYRVRYGGANRSWNVNTREDDEPLQLVGWWDVEPQFQRYLFVPLGNGFYRIQASSGGLSMEVMEALKDPDSAITQHEFNGGAHQQWAVQAIDGTAFPTNLEVSVGAEGYLLSWEAVSGADSYSVKRSASLDGPFETIAIGVDSNEYTDTSAVSGEIWHYLVSARFGSKESLDSAVATANPPRLLAQYGFDSSEGTIAYDDSESDLHGSLLGGASWGTGREGNAVVLDGVDDHVLLPQGIVSELSQATISAWVYLDARPTWSRVFDFGLGTGSYLFLTPSSSAGAVRFAITSGSGEQVINGPEPLVIGEWIHIAVTLDGATGILYLDGEEVGRNGSMSLTPADLGETTQNYLGRSQWSADAYLDGKIDDFRIYSNAFDAEGIRSLFEEAPRPPIAPEELMAPKLEIVGNMAYIRIESSVVGRGYQLQVSSYLEDPVWSNSGSMRYGDGEPLVLAVELDPQQSTTYFRIKLRK